MAQFAETNTRDQPGRFFEASDGARPKTAEAGTEIEHTAETVIRTVKEYPLVTLAVAAGLAFAVGALWKAGRPRPTRLEALQARLPDLPSARQINPIGGSGQPHEQTGKYALPIETQIS